MGSQKTLPMAMTVLSFFPPELGEPGLIAIPCILSHLTQLSILQRQSILRLRQLPRQLRLRLPHRPSVVARQGVGRGGRRVLLQLLLIMPEDQQSV